MLANLLMFSLFSALLASFAILLSEKTQTRNLAAVYAPSLINSLVSCDFCLAFWLNVIVAICMSYFYTDILLVLVAILATPITLKLLYGNY